LRAFSEAAQHRLPPELWWQGLQQASVKCDLKVIYSSRHGPDLARLSAAGQSMAVDEALALALEQ